MIKIKLQSDEWSFDPNFQLGKKGGFGTVYAGFSEKYGKVAIKQITFDDDAHREIKVADLLAKSPNLHYVIPIYDAGFDQQTRANYIVMARAEKNLQDDLNQGQIFSEDETINIMLCITLGLLEVEEVIHRDLKPANILFHEGTWKIADFGIARFVEETTSLRTLMGCLTPPFAAPEQWNYEHPTSAIDVYALGCIGYNLLVGHPPFLARTSEEYKNLHLHSVPDRLNIGNKSLSTLIINMLRKSPDMRPSLGHVKDLLIAAKNMPPLSGGFNKLASASEQFHQKISQDEARQSEINSVRKQRAITAREANEMLVEILQEFFDQVSGHLPVIDQSNTILDKLTNRISYFSAPKWVLRVPNVKIEIDFDTFREVPPNAFPQSKWDVITGATFEIEQEGSHHYLWGANFWFTNQGKNTEYRWWEIAYMGHPLKRTQVKEFEPFAVKSVEEADLAASPVMASIQFAYREPKLIDFEYKQNFFDRWADLIAQAINGEMRHPTYLPLD